jgi:hypothetical protein
MLKGEPEQFSIFHLSGKWERPFSSRMRQRILTAEETEDRRGEISPLRKIRLRPTGFSLLNKVTIYKLANRIPAFNKEATVGLNPFGIAYVP